MPKRLELTGQKFERLRVVRFWAISHSHTTWLCRCDCGNTRVAVGQHLKNGETKSCGCLTNEARAIACTGKNNAHYKMGDCCGNSTKEQREFHESIRKRDNYICQDCGKTQEQELEDRRSKLICHHINGNHTDNRDENAVTLCRDCHQPYTEKQKQEREEQEWLDAAYSVQHPEQQQV